MATTNIYENLEDDDLDEYGDYTTPWKLDCAATSTFSGQQTGILKRKKVKKGFDVMVANGEKITQIEEGIVLFDVPAAAAHAAVFNRIPAMAPYTATPFWGANYKGTYLPQNCVHSPHLEGERYSF